MLDKSFQEISDNIKNMITKTQLDVMSHANKKLVSLYYEIGHILYEKSDWGNKFIDSLSLDIRKSFPKLKGYSSRNLKYMKMFYNEYKDNDECLEIACLLPWKHNVLLIQKIKDIDIRKWYMEKCLEEGWSKAVLAYQIDTDLYKRQIGTVKHNNFKLTMDKNSELADEIMKEPYVFDLIELTEHFKERELEDKMIENLKKIFLEFGRGFSFVGNQYKVTVDDEDFYIDLLFYHTKLKCYVAIELKTGKFKPEYAGKMSFYLTALDNELKTDDDNRSIGLILCRSKSNKVTDYTLKYINLPVGVSEYKILNRKERKMIEDCLDENLEDNYILN